MNGFESFGTLWKALSQTFLRFHVPKSRVHHSKSLCIVFELIIKMPNLHFDWTRKEIKYMQYYGRGYLRLQEGKIAKFRYLQLLLNSSDISLVRDSWWDKNTSNALKFTYYIERCILYEGKSDLVSISANSKILLFSIFVTVISDGLYYSVCMAYTIHIYTCTIVAHSVYITDNIWSMGCFHFPGKKGFRACFLRKCVIYHTLIQMVWV